MKEQEFIDCILQNGYYVIHQEIQDIEKIVEQAQGLCTGKSYERGANYWVKPDKISSSLLKIVTNDLVSQVYKTKYDSIMQDICITHEYNGNKVSRNNYIHFDRLRSMKMLVYLTEVCENSGPFCISPGTHRIGKNLRRAFMNQHSYEKKKNRLELDYPDIEFKMKSILGPPGTTILFDSDTFHKGGEVVSGFNRLVIRSHWYRDNNWRVAS
jgi:hypothetical protein